MVCGEPLVIQGRPDTLTNPVMLVEVLSDATREYDRGQKFALYKEIPTLKEYVLVEQAKVLIEAFRRTQGRWVQESYDDLDANVNFRSVDLAMPLSQVYRQVFA